MTSKTAHFVVSATLEAGLSLPPRPEIEVSHAEKCDALIAFCGRASELRRSLSPTSPCVGSDLSLYVTLVQKMREGDSYRTSGSAERLPTAAATTPDEVARDLATLVTTHLGGCNDPEDAQFWLAVTSALSAATRETMPTLSETLRTTQSTILGQNAKSPTRSRSYFA